ncbi:permease [Paenibacillus sp. XY044]|uniref:permease n=1 Tax=Paenibacillus sp. XY044 TaxID=2026089 RepID=UPI000B989F78|nr:permease [Paenibacillus sp. XY044]OZB90447.1 permease [Paenibacillus sp. XY044]
MFAGHFGIGAAVKAVSPKTPLWAIMLGTQLLDVIFVPLLLTGIETSVETDGGGYGGAVIHADYTHSLVGALIIALLAGAAAWKLWGKRSAGVIGGVVFSHWLLDLLVHRSDMPILPGNLGSLPLMGFGLWKWPFISGALEVLLIVVGTVMYYRSLRLRARSAPKMPGRAEPAKAVWAAAVMAVLLMGSFISDLIGI